MAALVRQTEEIFWYAGDMEERNRVELKIGDLVQLNSGGPTMTVTDIAGDGADDDVIWCKWFTRGYSEKALVQRFSRAALEKVR